MKRFVPAVLLALSGFTASAQSVSVSVTTPPCHGDGILSLAITGLTPPLTVAYTSGGLYTSTITHTGVSGLSDVLTGYNGGGLEIIVTDATGIEFGYIYDGVTPFSYTFSASPAVCPANGTDTVFVSGGTPPYSYEWIENATNAAVGTGNPISLPAGSYGVMITDAAGCVYGSRYQYDGIAGIIPYVSPFTVTTATTAANCTNGTATATPSSGGTAPYTYRWSDGQVDAVISGLLMGEYSVRVTDANGCYANGRASVPQSVSLGLTMAATMPTCSASDGRVSVTPTGGTAPYSYIWSNGATTQSQAGLVPDLYGVTVRDANGCFDYNATSVGYAPPIAITYSTTPSLCTSPSGSATLRPSGGTGGYAIQWYTTPAQTTATAISLSPATYRYKVTDGSGCTVTGSVVVPPVSVIDAAFTATAARCATATGALAVMPVGGVAPYTYSWTTGATTAAISSIAAGSYTVSIRDNLGCRINRTYTVPATSPVTVGLTSTPVSCRFAADGSIAATPYGGIAPYTYNWNGGGATPTLTGLRPGYYTLKVTDAGGCTAGTDLLLDYNQSDSSCFCVIRGTVYRDANANCVQDAGEAGIPHVQMVCSGGVGYTYTDANGHYSFMAPTGTYFISQVVRPGFPLAPCQVNDIPASVTGASGCVQIINFADTTSPIHDVRISTWDYTPAIPGSDYRQAIVVTNDGSLPESTVFAGYRPDGQVFEPTFAPGAILSGAANYYNSGAMFPMLEPGASAHFVARYHTPPNIPLNTSLMFRDTVTYIAPMDTWVTDNTPNNNVSAFNTQVLGAASPNFKQVSPKGTGPIGLISAADSVLEYMIHFKNTGTQIANNVVVTDTLDDNLDWTTLRPLHESAPCYVTVSQSGARKVATFKFYDIYLITQTSDDQRSNGFFTYSIHTRRGLPAGTSFRNRASIYFGYNAPVLTNTTVNTLGATTNSVQQQVGAIEGSSFVVYPNPATLSFNAVLHNAAAGNGTIRVTDVTGKTLIATGIALQQGTQVIPVDASRLAPGIYFVTLAANGSTKTEKLVIMK